MKPHNATRIHSLSRARENGTPIEQSELYAVENLHGIYRRVPRERRSGLKTGDGNFLGYCEETDRLIELKRDIALETLLTQCGIGEPSEQAADD